MPTLPERFLRRAMRLASRGFGQTSPNPMVGALLVKGGEIIGQGWHRRAGEPHAEIEALRDAQKKGNATRGATLYVTLEPCCTTGRTPPCTQAIIAAGVTRVVAGATDPNPAHCGKGFRLLRRAGIAVTSGILARECEQLNEAFNHWVVHHTPLVTVKAAMTLDGKIATATGESKWITSPAARLEAMQMRRGADAILVGINTVLADDPSLTFRAVGKRQNTPQPRKDLRRIILDANARTPLTAKVVTDMQADLTTIVISRSAPPRRARALGRKVQVWTAPARDGKIDLRWLLQKLGSQDITSLLVEGGGEINAFFLFSGLANRVAFFYAPKILGGSNSRKAVAGKGAGRLDEIIQLENVKWRRIGPDWLLEAEVALR
ncbi:MAG TPA: bifunctional diaminohydroxyphosphoribosylaminopyrimidine deaminase/5-amino-6-(5-phosphoribosylamino)uracil reductase RibD [Verrucomicrobiae bacterium]|nr:bifunctional diaminohydroxyphosphoribosylaminopyrimidine deaminase/5-amino-6-(5-phosphoribosylamino)uracil reductase RibD [Verrucomicrobiae bacterium]